MLCRGRGGAAMGGQQLRMSCIARARLVWSAERPGGATRVARLPARARLLITAAHLFQNATCCRLDLESRLRAPRPGESGVHVTCRCGGSALSTATAYETKESAPRDTAAESRRFNWLSRMHAAHHGPLWHAVGPIRAHRTAGRRQARFTRRKSPRIHGSKHHLYAPVLSGHAAAVGISVAAAPPAAPCWRC